jgi:uncharacterized protein YbjT (DUF2867 family)
MTTSMHGTTLVVGGTGKTGGRVARRLRALDVPVRVGVPSGDPPFDWEDRSTWSPALEGSTAAYLTYYPDLAVPGATEAIAELAELAVRTGTRRLVLLSGRGEVGAQRAERALEGSGADWTVVRCAWFDQNFSEGQFLDPLLAGELALPADAELEPFVDVDDIADVAVAALTGEDHAGRVYELTGPRLLTFGDAVEEIARATGRDLRYRPIPMLDFEADLAAGGVPEEVVALVRYLFTKVLGYNAATSDGVQRALARPPRDFADFAGDAAADGVWSRGVAA